MHTGIQRNVTNILNRVKMLSDIYQVNVIPVISVNGKLYKIKNIGNKRTCSKYLSRLFGYVRNLTDIWHQRNRKHNEQNAVKASVNHEQSYHAKLINICRKIMPYIYFIAYIIDRTLLEYVPVTIKSNDIIFYADSFCNTETIKTISTYKSNTKLLLLYDIIPIVKPEYCNYIHVVNFKTNLDRFCKLTKGIITISCSEKLAVQKYLDTMYDNSNISIDYYYLGADFKQVAKNQVQVRDRVRQAMSSKNTFLVVGTLEPRKNHAFVLDTFETLWQKGINASLCIIGVPGLNSSEFISRIDAHQFKDKSLYFFDDADDQELAYCYEHCRAVIFPSIIEGFGLPLVEAMSYGRSVIASDIPVFREIGGDYPVYFQLDDRRSLENCIDYCLRAGFEKKEQRQWISWDESVRNLFGKVLTMADTKMDMKVVQQPQ